MLVVAALAKLRRSWGCRSWGSMSFRRPSRPRLTPRILIPLATAAKQAKEYIVGKYESYFREHEEEEVHHEHHIVVTSPKAMDVLITQKYVCQIHSQNHINVRAFVTGFLEKIAVKEGQAVKKGDLMFKIVPNSLHQARLEAENAEARHLAPAGVEEHQAVECDQSRGAVGGL